MGGVGQSLGRILLAGQGVIHVLEDRDQVVGTADHIFNDDANNPNVGDSYRVTYFEGRSLSQLPRILQIASNEFRLTADSVT